MTETKSRSVLVIFGQDFPRKNQKWWRQFDKVIAPNNLQEKIQSTGADFVNIEPLINPGSIQEANRLVNELPQMTVADGRTIPKIVTYRGYELWWMHYDDLMWEFCIPYTQYRDLLLFLGDFKKVCLYQTPRPVFFQYFLDAHNQHHVMLSKFRLRNLFPFPFGVFVQLLLSFVFLFCLKITRPRLMVWTGDKFAHPHDYDFRMKFIYEELRKKKVPFVEFIRSLESWSVVLKHAWRRQRPAIYSAAIVSTLHALAGFLKKNKKEGLDGSPLLAEADSEKRFWFLVATHYLHNIRGTIWSIKAMEFVLRWIGVRAAYISAGCSRTFHEVLGCKLAGIKTVGIQHAAIPRYAFIPDFMPGFDGKLKLSVDRYGLWSDWWRNYYLKYSRAYEPEQLCVSGPSRPLDKEALPKEAVQSKQGPLKVLFVSEQLAAPSEVLPFLSKLLEDRDFTLYLKCRPYRDGFEQWLKKNRPDILEKVTILRDTQESISKSDVVVGSHSSVVLEGLLQLKPIVFFWTNKWGDYFGIKDLDKESRFFASSPEELVDYIKKSSDMPEDVIKQLQKRFFGNPDKNGGKWVVEQALEFIKENESRK